MDEIEKIEVYFLKPVESYRPKLISPDLKGGLEFLAERGYRVCLDLETKAPKGWNEVGIVGKVLDMETVELLKERGFSICHKL